MTNSMNIARSLAIYVGLSALLSLLVSCKHPSEEAEKPAKLLFLMTDQQRFDALSFAGNTVLETPNLDRFAEEGVWFKNAYSYFSRKDLQEPCNDCR